MRTNRIALAAAMVSLAVSTPPSTAADDPGVAFFETKIRPVLIKECYSCHSVAQKKAKGGLELDSTAAILKGGDAGPSVVAGKPEASLLIKAINHGDDQLKMPPKAKMSDTAIADMTTWVKMGAPLPKDMGTATKAKTIDIEAGRKFWSFQSLAKVTPPQIQNPLIRNDVDRFILAKLAEKNLRQNASADREKLVRRAYFDITGLPPTVAEIDAFVNDTSPEAWNKLLDKLLASERYGERWARHWLDVVRFAESGGYEFDGERKGAFHYRDFVIRAFNQDMPYDQFIRWQLAGDKLVPGDFQATAATGFLVAGPYPGQTTQKTLEPIRYDQLDDMLSTTGTAFLGMTVGCARCHDHKYDPLPQEDYYRLLACLATTGSTTANLDPNPEIHKQEKAKWDAERTRLETEWQAWVRTKFASSFELWWAVNRDTIGVGHPFNPLNAVGMRLVATMNKSGDKLTDANRAEVATLARWFEPETKKAYAPVLAHIAAEPKPKLTAIFATGQQGGEVFFLIRGETGRKNGKPAPGFFRVLMSNAEQDARWVKKPVDKQPPTEPRVALANWMTDADTGAGQLLARVIVNRLWQHHLGRGLVATPNDFGVQGDRPTHPELLDYLATELIRNGWKLKPIHKLVMASAVYQQAGEDIAANRAADPDNKLWWRRPPRRMESEAVRDSLLAVGENLDLKMYGQGTLDEASLRRSVYLTVKRSKPVPILQLFDSPEAIQSIGERQVTTVPTQALTLMNSPFVRRQSELLAKRVRPAATELPVAVEAAYRTAFGRKPTAAEMSRATAFVAQLAETYGKGEPATARAFADFCHALLCSNEFVYVD
ncbi:MAG: PSD1 and planctomycete cytochrome C domain-containing protein [Planctomycetes bacterium]|nr:PSD1 and planctomycete cytochrome C domain-containing protein [Planctomycetota bacterium]